MFSRAPVDIWGSHSLSNCIVFQGSGCLLKEKGDLFLDFLVIFLERSVLANVSVCQGCYNKIPQAGWLKEEKYSVSQFWRVEIQDWGVSGVGSSWWLGRRLWHTTLAWLWGFVSLCGSSAWTVSPHISISSSQDVPLSACLSLCPQFSPFHVPVWFYLNQLHVQQPCFQIKSHAEGLGIRTSTYESLGNVIQPLTSNNNNNTHMAQNEPSAYQHSLFQPLWQFDEISTVIIPSL